MAASFNKVLLLGNLTRDPELRYIPSGQAVTTFSIAINRSYTSQTGERKEEVSFIRVVVWGRIAETCNEYLKKGSQVFVEGRLQSRSWEAQDGTKRNTIEVVAQSVQFLSRGGKAQSSSAAPAGTSSDDAIIDDSFEVPAGNKSNPSQDLGEEPPF
ncbi:MAG: single-stranded DNA-binding protein [Candidatus Omnitrophica bacterium CG11_big_fil_rev_8_21_14_0_20_45_26]|uniref:Single-stranded DNA-binding protein n=1 Tax=Candidatus Abzuiibacterium crystallinum TaxID=1974748 RepID=A0A2H0LSN7_9BACT|nr:MAG: single-stranded DNA-binding protein [Candidatus Omnitrophica bacterium CG11_big_fil_rev_8_21_14_0_20_45_26]PIW63411.1 MAG: single-stranded DNA-binding protein [Candidatus Omnitrophica bacterium CG12_big_fil_rev_8_21_14_0_65_45_16]